MVKGFHPEAPMFDLTGKTAVVTGGGRGIGRGIVRAMAQAGATLVVAGRAPGPLEEAVEEARALGARARAVPTDVTKAQFDAVVDLNLKWTFFAAQAAARAMTNGGSIINISSRSGSKPAPMTGQYGAAKAGVESLTGTMAVEWGHLGIRVNAIAPGVVITEPSEDRMTPSRRYRQVQSVPLQRLGTPDDVGPLCVYFAADESSWVTGSVVQVTGGSPVPVGYLTYLHHKNKDLDFGQPSSAASSE